ncbi:MAG: hypothetical protein A2X86_18925 [Bdellovibrionales bacterium GWA2_49_15]|nr:MAG: hypothetical protein A2X86_18925 [Bdellovibrionales bacterium GWA2_49_15]HAZ14300.1 hypothetical protein [Bdellovibrionales bacterium]
MDRDQKKKKKRQEKQDKNRQKKLVEAKVAPVIKYEKRKLGRVQIAFIFAIMALALVFVFYHMSHPI